MTAIFTLWEFGAPLLIALILAMPARPWRAAAVLTGAIGLSMLVIYWIRYTRAPRDSRPLDFDRQQFRWSFISLGTFGGMVAAGLMSEQPGTYLLASLAIWSLTSGTCEAWIHSKPPEPSPPPPST